MLHQGTGLVVDRAHRDESLSGLHVEVRDGLQQGTQVRMLGSLVQGNDRAAFHHAALVEDDDLLREIGHHPEIVGDDEHRHVELGLKLFDEREDLRLDRHVERRRGLVGNQQRWPTDQCHRNHRALAQAAGQFERVTAQRSRRIGKAHQAQHVLSPGDAFLAADLVVQEQRLADLIADGVQRRQRCHRLLEDHRDVAATYPADDRSVGLEARDVDRRLGRTGLGEQDFARRDARSSGQDPHHGLRRDRLARSRFAHQRHRRSGPDAK